LSVSRPILSSFLVLSLSKSIKYSSAPFFGRDRKFELCKEGQHSTWPTPDLKESCAHCPTRPPKLLLDLLRNSFCTCRKSFCFDNNNLHFRSVPMESFLLTSAPQFWLGCLSSLSEMTTIMDHLLPQVLFQGCHKMSQNDRSTICAF
jgi:hypothetical protein